MSEEGYINNILGNFLCDKTIEIEWLDTIEHYEAKYLSSKLPILCKAGIQKVSTWNNFHGIYRFSLSESLPKDQRFYITDPLLNKSYPYKINY